MTSSVGEALQFLLQQPRTACSPLKPSKPDLIRIRIVIILILISNKNKNTKITIAINSNSNLNPINPKDHENPSPRKPVFVHSRQC